MISPEGIKLLNSILYDFPIEQMFSVSDYTANKKDGHSFDKEIADFLLHEGFANFIRSNVLSREKEHRQFRLTDIGIKLQDAGSYEAYYKSLNKNILNLTNNQEKQYTITERLTGIVALWTFVAGLYYIAQLLIIFIPDHFWHRRFIIYAITGLSLLVGVRYLYKIRIVFGR